MALYRRAMALKKSLPRPNPSPTSCLLRTQRATAHRPGAHQPSPTLILPASLPSRMLPESPPPDVPYAAARHTVSSCLAPHWMSPLHCLPVAPVPLSPGCSGAAFPRMASPPLPPAAQRPCATHLLSPPSRSRIPFTTTRIS
jgi:hypothetical protein